MAEWPIDYPEETGTLTDNMFTGGYNPDTTIEGYHQRKFRLSNLRGYFTAGVSANLSGETAAREAADAALNLSLTEETAQRITADAELQAALSGIPSAYIPVTQKGVASGVASLGLDGKVPASQMSITGLNIKGFWSAETNTPTLTNGTGTTGDFYICNAAGSVNFGAGSISFNKGDWVLYITGVWGKVENSTLVQSVNGYTGVIVLGKADVGLGNVDNTADAVKSVASAAKWTTARNVTISDDSLSHTGSAVSVDGSGAVTLKLPATIAANIIGAITGNASTATVLQAARTISIQTDSGATLASVSFDGSASATFTLPAIVPIDISGNAATADTAAHCSGTVSKSDAWAAPISVYLSDATGAHAGAGVALDGSSNVTFTLPSVIAANIIGAVSGNADTASKLATARTIAIQNSLGVSIATVSFDGSTNATFTLPAIVPIDISGNVENAITAETCTGNSATASALEMTRNISVQDATGAHTGVATGFNGAGDVTLKLPPAISANVSGNADTASKLATPRSITLKNNSGVTMATTTFDGSDTATLTLPALVPIDITGSVETATKLATARTIALSGDATGSTSFDGSADVTIAAQVPGKVNNLFPGEVWSQSGATSGSFYGVSLYERYGIAGESSTGLYYTSDYGHTWTQSLAGDFRCVSLYGQYGIAGSDGSGLYYSSDYGHTWSHSGVTSGSFLGVSLYGQYGVSGINGGAGLYYTSDYGHTWTQSNVTSGTFNSVSISGQYGIAGSILGTGIYYTSDYGHTWFPSDVTSGSFYGVSLCGQYGVAGGSSVGLYYTADYGHTWIQSFSGDFRCVSLYGNYGIAGTPSSGLYITSDRGHTWIQSKTTSGFFGGVSVFEEYGIAGNIGTGLYYSTGITDASTVLDLLNTKLDTTGTAALATKLATARTIGGVSFDGTANINLPGVNTGGNQNTSGNAGTATKLAAAISAYISDSTGINTGAAVSFDGSGNVTFKLPATIVAALAGNADTATALKTARTIYLKNSDGTTLASVYFDGTSDAVLNLASLVPIIISGGVNTASGTIKVGTGSDDAGNTSILVHRLLTTSSNAHGFSDETEFTGTNGTAFNSYDSRPSTQGSADFNHIVSFQGNCNHASSGTLTNMYGVYILNSNNGGAISYLTQFCADNPGGTGVIQKLFGYYSKHLTRGSENWGFYDDNNKNHLGSYMETQTPFSPGSKGVSYKMIGKSTSTSLQSGDGVALSVKIMNSSEVVAFEQNVIEVTYQGSSTGSSRFIGDSDSVSGLNLGNGKPGTYLTVGIPASSSAIIPKGTYMFASPPSDTVSLCVKDGSGGWSSSVKNYGGGLVISDGSNFCFATSSTSSVTMQARCLA